MPADAAASAGAAPPPPPPARSDSAASSATPSEADLDALHYANLPLGLVSPTVIEHGTSAQHPALTAGRRRYLCYFLHRHLECRLAEVESLAGAARRRLNGFSSSTSGDGSGGEGPAVVWEKPFGNRVRPPLHVACRRWLLPPPLVAAAAGACKSLCTGAAGWQWCAARRIF